MPGEYPSVTAWKPSPNYHSPSNRRSKLKVVHTVQSPLTDTIVNVLAGPAWFGKTESKTSAHFIIGPISRIQMVLSKYAAWAVGPNANYITENFEQSGYAGFSRAEWLVSAGLAQIANLALVMSDSAKADGATSLKRATDNDILRYANGTDIGSMWCIHHDITRLLHGTTHTDTGLNYPEDVLQNEIDRHFDTTIPEDDMPLSEAEWAKLETLVRKAVKEESGPAVWKTVLKGGYLKASAGAAIADIFTQVRKLRGQ